MTCRSLARLSGACLVFVCLAGAQVTIRAQRLSNDPLLAPDKDWASQGLFNPAAVAMGGDTVLLYRATDAHNVSRIGYARSRDGKHFVSDAQPVLVPEAEYEKGGGVEDPRVVKIDGIYYLTYTGYNLHDAQLCLATSADLKHWDRKGIILPAYKGTWNTGWTKSGAIVPQKINGKWWMYYLGTAKGPDGVARDQMGVASSGDLLHWTDASGKPVLELHANAFDSRVMEPGPPPIVTPAGILLLYNGADEHLVYRPAWVLFARNDPARVIARAVEPFMAPQLDWERVGVVPNVIFLEGAVPAPSSSRGSIDLIGYYGAADKFIGAIHIEIQVKPD